MLVRMTAAALMIACASPIASAAIVQEGSGLGDADAKGADFDSVKKRLDGIVASLKKRKFTEVKSLEQGAMKTDGGAGKTVVLLDAKTEYVFSARGDRGCKNVDLAVKDGAGKLMDSDTERDANPSFRWTPKTSGSYTLEVTVSKCSAKQTQVGAVVIAKPVSP